MTTDTTTTKRKKAVNIDHNELVEVMNGSPSKLIYKNKQTQATQEWQEYGEVQLMTVQELMNARGQQPRFFRDQWFVVLDADVINYLKLDSFYKNLMKPEELEVFFDQDADQIEESLKKLSNGAKMLVAGRARKLYEDGLLTDVHKIKAVNSALGIHIAD
ncbi:hypothetical protein QB910_000023 [Dabrowskivirus KKP3916]|uniref:Uncharacterized protein n=1 Tax=Alicyclobacillus phage KKP_3916 TaxID=3040651 RepID=A0AAT9V8P3_9CAUD|nr:hypothetical protein QB910_000023 [Alicyclobacillus phage KKP 3916]